MSADNMLISKGNLIKDQLKGEVALITGAGGGIGYEAARALAWLGAKVVIAEIDKMKGSHAEKEINKEFGIGSAIFIQSNIGNESSVKRLIKKTNSAFGEIDILINNATITPMGSVHEVGIKNWDLSYGVNLRGPVLLISQILPGMLKRNSGVIVLVPSSGAAPYMGAYEVFKTSQVELANTLAAELEHTEVITYSIGPGFVKTDTARKSIEKIAPLYGKSIDEFYQMSQTMLLTAEEAGVGFAASVALAKQYRGLEIGSIQALTDAGITIAEKRECSDLKLTEDDRIKAWDLFMKVKTTFTEQLEGWSTRPVFERQWVMRDFKKFMGASPEYFLDILKELEAAIRENRIPESILEKQCLEKIAAYYLHQIELLKGYEKNKSRVAEYTDIMNGWIEAIEGLEACMKRAEPADEQ